MDLLPTGEVHIWVADLGEADWPPAGNLQATERERAAAFLREDAAARWVASRWALRRVLSRYLDEAPAAIGLVSEEGGKPRLADASSKLRFNLSHSGDLALVAITCGREVGVDVEEVEPAHDLLALAERALSSDAAAAVAAADPADRAAVFHQAWTRHEARLKCLGIGLGGTDGDEMVAVADLEVAPGYAAAVAVSGAALGTLRRFTIGS